MRRRSSCSTAFPNPIAPGARLAPLLADRLRLVMPDLRGFGDSDRPQEVAAYATDTLIADMFALADALGSIGSRWSAMTGAAPSPGQRRYAAIRGSSGWRSSIRPIR